MASDFRLPIVRSSRARAAAARSRPSRRPARSTCPGGVGTTLRFHYMTANTGARCRWWRSGLGSVAGLGAARLVASHYSIMTKSPRRCSWPGRRWWRALGQSSASTELGGWEIQTPQRRGRPRGRYRGGGVRLRAAVSVLPAASVSTPAAARRRATTIPSGADEMPDRA